MRVLAVVLSASLMTGCAATSYQIPTRELTRLASTPPEQRGQHVRVVQDIRNADVPAADPVNTDTQIIIVPSVNVSGSVGGSRYPRGGRGGSGAGELGKIGGPGNDAKKAAIAVLVLAATAAVTAAAIEGSRFDGWAELHPMHPVHLFGKNGDYTVMPLAWIDPQAASHTERAVVRSTEGPWRELERAPLSRQGLYFGMYGGSGSLTSADGTLGMGPAWTVQLGGYPTQEVGIVGSLFFGWRDNRYRETLFETRTGVELHLMPLQLGILHGGVYGGVAYAHRFEDVVKMTGTTVVDSEQTGLALGGGAMFQLDINTRLALTARLGATRAHGEQMHDVLIGLAIY